jgi:hypothetical protein
VEHRLPYLSIESRSREGDQHRPQSGCTAPMCGRPLGNPPSNREMSDAHDLDAFIIGQCLPYRCFCNKGLTAHSAHRRQRELLRHLQHVHGVVTAAVSKIRCQGQRADENDSGEHRRNSRSGAWVRSFTWHRSRRRRGCSIPSWFHGGSILDTETKLTFTFPGRWLPSTARGAVVVRSVRAADLDHAERQWRVAGLGVAPVSQDRPLVALRDARELLRQRRWRPADPLPRAGRHAESRRDRRLRARRTTIWLPRACFGGGRVNVRGSVRAMAPPTRMSPFSESRPSRIPSSSWSTRHRGDRLPHAQTH